MKNQSSLLWVAFLAAVLGLGCNWIPGVGGATEDAGNPADGIAQKIGIPECDELIDQISRDMQSPDDNYLSRTFREYFLRKIRESIRQSLEENQANKEETATHCRELKTEYEKQKAENQNNNSN